MKKTLAFLLIAINTLLLHAEPVKLINDAAQLYTDCGQNGNNDLSVLLDGNVDTFWQSDKGNNVGNEHYIDVIFNDGLELGADECLVVKIQRSAGTVTAHPTAFELRGSNDPNSVTDVPVNWTEGFRYAFFTYRGEKTIEYSGRIALIQGKKYYRIRFILKANNSKSFSQAGYRYMNISGFQIYKLSNTDSYPDNMADRFHLKSDMHMDFADYELLRTGGILDPTVRAGSGFAGSWFEKGFYLDSEGKWTANPDFFEKHKDELTPPDFTPVSKENDSRIKTDVKYQPTHIVEHELYAIPGDAVALYPFYGFNTISNYNEVFSHWYNYETGGNVTDERGNRLLDFLIDPSGIAKSNNYGWFGGKSLKYGKYIERKTYQINTVDDYKMFVAACNGGENNAVGILNQDLDFKNVTDVNPIGTRNEPFIGYFNGNGHTIRNLKMTKNTECVGIFGAIGTGAIIGNFVIDSSCSFTGSRLVGVIGAYYEVKINGSNVTRIENIVNHGDIIGTNTANSYCGGILGSIQSGNNVKHSSVYIRNCAFTGHLTGNKNNGLLCGYAHYDVELYPEHCFSTGSFTDIDAVQNDNNCRFVIPHAFARCHTTNCYSTIAPVIELNNKLLTGDISANEETTEAFTQKIGGGWQYNPDGFPTVNVAYPEVPAEAPNALLYSFEREYGTIATFFYPRDVTQHQLQSLDKDYYIAADFSQEINFDLFFDSQNKTIIEPLINFRHIFHIKDGKKFADDNFSTKEKNEAYIRKNLRHITAEAGKNFQIRLDSPLPKETTTRSRLYYNVTADGTDYRRVCSMRIRVKDSNGNIIKDIDAPNNLTDNSSFYASETFQGYGSRVIDGITYNACGGGSTYYRMLACDADKAVEGTFTVQLVGLDYNGEVIIIPDGSGAQLLIQEFQITFLPKTAAVLVPEAELKKNEFRRVTNEWLTTNFGAPRDRVDYDEYLLYRELPMDDLKRYLDWNNSRGIGRIKWPLSWPLSNYSFTYSSQRDYNMYMVASHSDRLQYSEMPDKNMTSEKNFNQGEGLFDRKFYETEGVQKGFYVWVNAAADPGVMAYLSLGDFCPGSTIHISGWVSEFTEGEMANLAINFVAVLTNGERVPLHTHTTGYLPSDKNLLGTWMYFYASFVLIFTDKDFDVKDVDHYEIELDNNCKNSGGADYAIDDLRVYLVKPVVYADQLNPMCFGSEKSDIKVSAPFDVLMQSLGKMPATDAADGENLKLYYSFIDYGKFKQLLDENMSSDDAFKESVLYYNYRGGAGKSFFGAINFNSHFDSNEEYHSAGSTLSESAFRQTVNGTKMIAFNTRPEDEGMISGKEYMVVLYLDDENTTFDESNAAALYQIGSIGTNNDCSRSCTFRVMAANSIKIDGEVKNPDEIIESCRNQSPVVQVDLYAQIDGELQLVEEDARFDWFTGTMEYFSQIKENGVTLWDAIAHFRDYYPEATGIEGCEPQGYFTDADKAIIDKYSRVDPTGRTKPLLYLSQNSFVFPPLILAPDEPERQEYVLAVPIPVIKEGEMQNCLICTQPTEVRVTVRQRAPRLKHGFNEIEYPAVIDDVPLRVSLSEMKKVSVNGIPVKDHNYLLEIPIYEVTPVTERVNSMRLPGGGSPIYMVQTDDPEYKSLDFENPVGELRNIEAVKDATDNRFRALFYGDDISFKEGYTYRFRFTFEENNALAVSDEEVCSGQDVFTIKVVPEFQKWTGATNLNWNNDANWRRVKSEELLSDAPSDFTTDGSNANGFSFAPLDFTKVIIPEGATVPHLFKETTEQKEGFNWANQPSEDKSVGDATALVQYDMAQLLKEGVDGVYCRPWYAHTCDQIHFEPRSQISGQQFLHYNGAWVDMELSPSLWLTASSPLQGVVAGDMYLPAVGARQNTEYFQPITYDANKNNRFKPAVFQRSWNQASATIYKWPGHDNDTEDAAVRTTWSHVYNDVRVPYAPGHGFSVRNDISKFGESKPEKVLFRLPKADTFYDYYTDGGETGDKTTINRTNPGRLNFDEFTASQTLSATIYAATDDNKLFLVGNPFMAHLDMKEFFDTNINLEPKYWILTGELQGAAVMSPDGTFEASTGGVPDYLPPLAGFFVEAKNPGKKLDLVFTADMMAIPEVEAESRSVGGSYGGAIRITAVESGSTALILSDPLSDAGYDSAEDAFFVNDSSLDAGAKIYTSAGGYAMTVNTCPEIEGTEVGVIADEKSTVTLRFNGVDRADGLMLYDAVDNTYQPLDEDAEIAVTGAAKGRLFIVSDCMDRLVNSISIKLVGQTISVSSTAGGLEAKVYNVSGALIDANYDKGREAVFTLVPGIYIIRAADCENTLVSKYMVR